MPGPLLLTAVGGARI